MTNIQGRAKSDRVTLHDVARAAGVSKSSVSRLLDERLPRSNSEVAQRVRKVAKELGYVRDISAANLRRGNTSMIGLIVPRLTDTVMAMLYEALQRAASKTGKVVIVATTDETPEAERRAADTLIGRGVESLILATARHDDPFTKELAERGVKYVQALRTDGIGLSSIGDDQLGGYLATRHLIDLGHRKIGLIAGPAFASTASKRTAGYHQAMQEARLPVDESWIVPSTFGIESGREAVKQLISLPDRPTAVFAVNDNIAIGAFAAIHQMGLSVPQDISLVGYNDIPIVSHLTTPMTSVHVPFDQIASAAFELLNADELSPQERTKISIPTLIPRQSTAPIKA
ncbi:LacI family DNA-binding transcriptional regulator [Cohaesibacter celericrescens]|uniref:LacI family transcriptional regulator n=1 Tax=Cohaesibacter celericrescens TaxID=2067669 RepID=A0A2N5XPS5_9HYPH|nr:LacI family DNA-binding transcriptional regulator [Cohaesibacter celericrescens]PLW76531.1 LacI family transcriptional regulator [Cohaesibacter celericrescens]